MKFFLSLTLAFFILTCKTPNLILKEPNNKNTPGLVAFGLFIYDDVTPNLGDSTAIYKMPEASRTFFYAIDEIKQELDPMSRIIISRDKTIDDIEINGKIYNEQTRITLKNDYIKYFLFSDLEEGKKYLAEKTGYSFTTVLISVRGKRTNQLNYIDLPLQLSDPDKLLKFESVDGKISFLGNYKIRVVVEKKGFFFDLGEKKIGVVEKFNPNPKDALNPGLMESIYGREEISSKGAEIYFLKQLLMNSRDGYWKKMIEQRLLELTKN